MPELPPVSEDFTADASGYLAAIQEMIDKTRDLIDEVAELRDMIDDLPSLKNIEINITGDAIDVIETIREDLDSLDDRTLIVNVIYKNIGRPEGIADQTETIKQVVVPAKQAAPAEDITESLNVTGANGDQIKEMASDLDALGNDARDASTSLDELAGRVQELGRQLGMTSAAISEDFNAQVEDMRVSGMSEDEIVTSMAVGIEHLSQMMNESRGASEGMAEGLDQVAVEAKKAADSSSLAAMAIQDIQDRLAAGTIKGTEAAHAMSAVAFSLQVMGGSAKDSSTDLNYFQNIVSKGGGDLDVFNTNVGKNIPTMVAFALAMKAAQSNIGGALIPISAASFGITGLGTAIHLAVMGTFEFLAVFIPAMIAGGAAALVMMQGLDNVKTSVTSMYTAAEALGPMVGQTAGDMLGLGHSLQTAQNLADPGVYELLGAAINGIKEATVNAGGGLSSFGQMGLTVLSIVDRFAASLDVELGANMGKLTSIISGGVSDLVMFGQILGNIGHAIINLAAAMPGLAEVILKIIDGFSELIKWVSNLPAPLLAVAFGIEEAYRWSGLAAGAFGLLGRAMALLGTLGIPVIVKIGSNMAAMVGSVIQGIGGLVANFSALTEKVIMGAASMAEAMGASGLAEKFLGAATMIDGGAEGIVGALGKAAAFMGGPWGIAIALAVAGIATLTIYMLKQKSVTEQWIEAQQQAVQSATNLEVLNQIGNSLANSQKLVAINVTSANNALKESGGAASVAREGFGALGVTYDQSSGAAKELTGYQKDLFDQSQNVIQGAMAISKTYKVDFTQALGLADAAQVKLVDGYTGSSHAAEVARQEVFNLVTAYSKMDQSGTILANTMQAISVQAGLQASKVQQVNSAWDNFLSMATGLTGGLSQLNLDLQQMGNIAPAVGSKIQAFSGQTSMSISQIAASLKGFSGQSAQTWQAYNQSLQGAEQFTDSLRTAAAAGVVTQGQYKQAIAAVVGQLLPYAADSQAARAELSVLAQEAGYAGGTSFASLKSWIDKTGGSTTNLGGLVDSLTAKLSNVSSVAKNFAGTLQSDVLGAMAQAAVGTSGITKLTQAYTQSLQANGAQAPQTKAAQDALTSALEKEGFTTTETNQLTQELSTAYNNNSNAAKGTTDATNNLDTAANNMAGTLQGPARAAVDEVKAHTDDFTNALNQGLTPAMGTAGDKASSTTHGPLNDLDQMVQDIHTWTQKMESVMSNWPTSEHTDVKVSGSGGTKISSNIPGAASGQINLSGFGLGLAEGGVLPGFDPGHDTIPALLSPGEGILTPGAVNAIGGKDTIDMLNRLSPKAYQRYAGGGIVLPNVVGWAQGTLNNASKAITQGFASEVNAAIAYYKNQEKIFAEESGPAGGATGSEMANGMELYQYLLANVFRGDKIAAAGATASIWGESTWNPFAINCVPLTYKVVTTRGILKHDEVEVGDKTPVYNPETGQVEEAVILDVPYHYDAQICRLGNLDWSVVCTWDHKWITEDGLVQAQDMYPGVKILVGEGHWEVIEFAWDLGVEDTFCLTTTTGTWTAYRGEDVAEDEGCEVGEFWTGNSSGRGLIGWTPQGTISNADFEGGMRTQLPAIIRFINTSGDWGVIAEMMRAGSVLDAANLWGKGVERYGINDVHSTGIALATSFMNSAPGNTAPAQGLGDAIARAKKSTQDAGGFLYPGLNLIDNKTGGIERTVGPNEETGTQGMAHVVLNIDGKSFLDAIAPAMYKKGSANNGNANANKYWAPGNK